MQYLNGKAGDIERIIHVKRGVAAACLREHKEIRAQK